MRALRDLAAGAAAFLYRFLVGDDPIVAATMVAALVATGLAVRAGGDPWWLVPTTAVLLTALSLYRHRSAA